MKKPKPRANEVKAFASLRERPQKRRDAADDARAREPIASGDLMWGDEGIDDPEYPRGS